MDQGLPLATRRQVLGMFAVSVAAPGLALAADSPRLNLRLLATSDLHCYLEAYDYYRDAPDDAVGLVRVASLVRAARRETPNTLLFDNGDLIQGNPLGDLAASVPTAHHPVIAAMNALGYDAATPGNHDFNFGLGHLSRTIAGARFPYVLGNVDRIDPAGRPPRCCRPMRCWSAASRMSRAAAIGSRSACSAW